MHLFVGAGILVFDGEDTKDNERGVSGSMSKKDKFIIIDGNSLIYRAFFALPLLSTSQGMFTNAAYGFTNMLMKILEDEKPQYIGVAFDKGRPVFRVESYPEYKGHRPQTPSELAPQFGLAKQILSALAIPVLEIEGYEADDIIGTLSAQADAKGIETVIVTSDKDAFQLISEHTKVLVTRKGLTEVELVDAAKLWEKYNLEPWQIIDLKGLMGDPSDNIPGVAGVGEKTALKLLYEFGSVEQVYTNLDQVKGKMQEKLAAGEQQAKLSKQLATIYREVPVVVDWEDLKLTDADEDKLLELYKALEFKGLVKKLLERKSIGTQAGSKNPEVQTTNAPQVTAHKWSAEQVERIMNLQDGAEIAVFLVSNNAHWQKADITHGVISFTPTEHYYFSFTSEAVDWLREILENPAIGKVCHDGKQLIWLAHRAGIKVQGLVFDTMLASYIVNPVNTNQDLDAVCLEHLNQVLPPADQPVGWCTRTETLWDLKRCLTEKLHELAMDQLFYQVEMPLVTVLAELEITGVRVDGLQLTEMGLRLGASIEVLTKEICTLAGEEFNINSTKQLGHILFEKLQLPVIKKTKTGYSTDASVLEELAEQHEVVRKILEYRQLMKLKSTYVDGLKGLINSETGRIHTTFNQTITATGRLSSTEPNLQNIPIRMEEGRKIRKVFVSSKIDNVLLAADYSQIELRILAHVSEDVNLQEAFRMEQDIHTRTASEVFGVPMEEVTKEMRSRAKAVNFGIVYGISDYGLSQDLKVTRKEAKLYIDSYFARYPGVRGYIDKVIQSARDTGYVTTILNRRRYLPDIFSSNFNVRSFGERTAMNTPIQGSAADIIKLAMIEVQKEIKNRGLNSRMILQVHDELIFDVPQSELDEMIQLVRDCMQEAVSLSIPLVVDMKVGPNWYDVKEL